MSGAMEVDTTSSPERQDIDDSLYSRQLYVLGHEAMEKMRNSSVLIVGLRGLGVEIAKNVILAGVKSVTLHDDGPTTFMDLSAQFFLSEKDVGNPRAPTVLEKLAELNSYVPVSVHQGELTESVFVKHQVVLLAGQSMDLVARANKICHQNNIAFIAAATHGVFANVFCDFGSKFEVFDTNGEPPQSLLVTGITQENPGIVTVSDEHRIPFETGDFITFNEVQGMTQINGGVPRKITVLSPYTFSIEDTTGYSPYSGGGYAIQVKQSQILDFKSLEESIEQPQFIVSDFAKEERNPQIHLGFQALWKFFEKHSHLPSPHNEEHAKEVVSLAGEINSKLSKPLVEKIDEKLIQLISFGATGELCPMTGFIGGIAAQEVLKACSGKFMPITQWFYFDATEILPSEKTPSEEFQPVGSRYDGQIVVLGKTLHTKLRNLSYFLVGAGAIGCEVLKTWAMMGVGTGPNGTIHITDMDRIERSNLNRQFLFRPKDVEQPKSTTAAKAVKAMNPEVKIKPYENRVGVETENIFNEEFYGSLDGVCNALDNVEARMYMDSQCIFYKKPLLESGTLGTKGNTQVIVPHKTESYASSRDPPEKSIPICTLHHFPNAIEHTIQWARDVFEGLFRNHPESVNAYITNPGFMDTLNKQSGGSKLETLNSIKSALVDEKPINFENCITWARLKLEEFFNNNIQQLLYNFPVDMITSTGAPFWSGPKRAPKPVLFSMDDPLQLDFIVAAANLRAQIYQIPGTRDLSVFKKFLPNVMVPEFTPKKGVKISTTESEAQQQREQEDDEDACKRILGELPSPSKLAAWRMTPLEFEKDDDTNFHMAYITAAANLRATNYAIPLADFHKCKGIAGKIIPAMVTTTAVVSGLVCLELVKIMQDKPLDQLKNGFVNLALPLFAFSEPIEPQKTKIRDGWEWTLWDRFDVEGPLTLQEFINYFKEKHQFEVTMVSCGVSMIYSFFMSKDKLNERLPKPLSEVVSSVSKQAIPKGKTFLSFEICVNRLEDGEEVDVPFVRYEFKN